MPKEIKKCDKCQQSLGYPYYRLHIEEKNLDNDKSFCLGCWRQEEKNYRKMSEDYFNQPWGLGLKYVHRHEVALGITIIHWVEDLKQWRYGRKPDDYDKDIDTSESTPNREREREKPNFKRNVTVATIKKIELKTMAYL